MSFIKGNIEFLDKAGLKDESFDIIVSNCVVNLSPDKERVINEAYRVLAPGGEFYFSDVYCDRYTHTHTHPPPQPNCNINHKSRLTCPRGLKTQNRRKQFN